MPKAIRPTATEVDEFIAEHGIEITASGAMLSPWDLDIPSQMGKALNARANAAHRAWVDAGRPLPAN